MNVNALLKVQEIDLEVDRLHHNEKTLTEPLKKALVALDQVEKERAALDSQIHDLQAEQKRLDDGIASIQAKRDQANTKLYSGELTNPRELQDLQDEINMFDRQITELEETDLEVMEKIEPLEQLAADTSKLDAANEALKTAKTELTVQTAETQSALSRLAADRENLVGEIENPLLSEYETLRSPGVVAVARLNGNQCGACHLTLSAMEVRKVKKSGIHHCEECGALIVNPT